MCRKILLVEVTLVDELNGEIEKKSIFNYQGDYGYEVRNFFERIGEKFSKIIDPSDI